MCSLMYDPLRTFGIVYISENFILFWVCAIDSIVYNVVYCSYVVWKTSYLFYVPEILSKDVLM